MQVDVIFAVKPTRFGRGPSHCLLLVLALGQWACSDEIEGITTSSHVSSLKNGYVQNVSKLHSSTDPKWKITVVLLGEAYTAASLSKYKSDANAIVTMFNNSDWFKNHVSDFEAQRVDVVSSSDVLEGNTAFGALPQGSPQRCIKNAAAVSSDVQTTSATLGLNAEAFILIINSKVDIECANDNVFFVSANISGISGRFAHGLGHAIANLGDEFEDQGIVPYLSNIGWWKSTAQKSFKNISDTAVRNSLKWAQMVALSTPLPTPDTYQNVVGAFEGAAYLDTGLFRPQLNCIMRNPSYSKFCEVCRKELEERWKKSTGALDMDGDGLSQKLEDHLGTDPTLKDSDGDGLGDGEEDANKNGVVDGTETNPIMKDTDGDGLDDLADTKAGCSAIKSDTDSDGITDANEVKAKTNCSDSDTDKDGLSDGEEYARHTDPFRPDSDNDGIPDGHEVKIGTNPLLPDSDNDTLNDGDEVKKGTNPKNPDTDADKLKDGVEEKDGCSPLLDDTDGDGVDDYVEVIVLGTQCSDPDTDGDGLGDGAEGYYRTDPKNKDTDNDGMPDGMEVTKTATDPLAAEKPGGGGMFGGCTLTEVPNKQGLTWVLPCLFLIYLRPRRK